MSSSQRTPGGFPNDRFFLSSFRFLFAMDTPSAGKPSFAISLSPANKRRCQREYVIALPTRSGCPPSVDRKGRDNSNNLAWRVVSYRETLLLGGFSDLRFPKVFCENSYQKAPISSGKSRLRAVCTTKT